VRGFNTTARSFPTNLTAKMFDFQVKPNFTVANEQAIAAPPTVDFGEAPARPATTPAPDGAGSAGSARSAAPGTGQPVNK
jgi:LemA protein